MDPEELWFMFSSNQVMLQVRWMIPRMIILTMDKLVVLVNKR